MTMLAFPSVDCPSLTGCSVDLPDGWVPVVAPGAVLAAVRQADEGVFRANVAVTVTRFAAGYALDTAVAELQAKLATLAEVEEVGVAAIGLGSVDAHAQEIAFAEPRTGTLVQAHRLAVVENGPAADLVHAVGTCAGDAIEHDLREIRTCLDTLVMTSAAEL